MEASPIRGPIGAALAALALAAIAGCGYSNVDTRRDAGAPDAGSTIAGGGCFDNDGDGAPGTGDCASEPIIDCDDQNPARAPGAQEVCDGADNDCDSEADEGLALIDHFIDGDGDGYGAGEAVQSCHAQVDGRVAKGGDCNDQDATVHPGAAEACNNADDDCDGQTDDDVQFRDFYTDADQDGFGAGAATQSCQATVPGKVTADGDCDDGNPDVKPGATEQCNGVDDNCDGNTDDIFPAKGNACQTGQSGVCAQGTTQCVSGSQACVPITGATAELCDGLDNDCDGASDEDFPDKNTACTAGLGVCLASGTYVCNAAQTGTVCTATPGQPNAAACDGQDNDCDGMVDEGEFTAWWDTATTTDPTAMDVAPFFYTAASCNGGQAGSGNDAWAGYYAAYVVGGDLRLQRLYEDGDGNGAPIDISNFTSNTDVAVVQAGDGIAVVALWGTTYLDLYYAGPGPQQRTIGTAKTKTLHQVSGSTISNVRAVRADGGRFVVLWTETSSLGASKIRMARYHLVRATATDYTLVVDTAPMDLIATASGAFGVASNLEEYGDSVGCRPVSSRAALGVAYVNDSSTTRSLRFETFYEDGTAFGLIRTVYASTNTAVVLGAPDVAWAYASGDRWAVAHTFASSSTNIARVNFWQSSQSTNSTAFGPNHSGKGTSSVEQPRVSARTGEFVISALAYGTATDAQVWAGKKGYDGSTVRLLSQMTWASGCSLAFCTSGVRKLPRALSSDSGTYKTQGAVLFGGAQGGVRAGNVGCN